MRQTGGEPVIEIRGLSVGFGHGLVLERLDLDLDRGEVLGVVGASGSGKSVLLRAIVGLLPIRCGHVRMVGRDMVHGNLDNSGIGGGIGGGVGWFGFKPRWGVLFQDGALFSSLTVRQNIQVPMREHLDLSQETMDELAALKIDMVGLPSGAAELLPAELSGGMRKRAGLARTLALDPEIIFLDEPTAGLDPIGAAEFDRLLAKLQHTLGISVFMVTHDLDSLHAVCDRIAVLSGKTVLVTGSIEEMRRFDDPWVHAYFNNPRARMPLA